MASIDFEGRHLRIERGDTVASALLRAGVRTFARSIKHHRRRGPYCLTGDCASCLLTIDGVPGERSCVLPALDGMRVEREGGWPSTELDILEILDRAHVLLPVGFYYKAFVHPRIAWPIAERVIRRFTGIGTLPLDRAPAARDARDAHADVVVVGAGVAGLSASIAAANDGARVIVVDELGVGDRLLPGADRDRVASLRAESSAAGVEVLEHRTAIGVYDGPIVPVAGEREVIRVHAGRVVVATGAVEAHPVFPGNDVPGVMLGRGAGMLAARHRVVPGERIVAVVETLEGFDQVRALQNAGVRPVLASSLDVPDDVRAGVTEVLPHGRVVAVEGRRSVRRVLLETRAGTRAFACDALVLGVGAVPRDALLRMSAGLSASGAGEVVAPGCSFEEAAESGTAAGRNAAPIEPPADTRVPPVGRDGYVCPCEDVSLHDLRGAWREGWRSPEILKRYTTATMGPCQGALCARHLAAFVRGSGGATASSGLTTARPPARPIPLEDLAAGVHEIVEKRTSLHDRHVQAGGRVERSGSWLRPYRYGDVAAEYRAVRERASVMDVGTLAKFLVGGRDAAALLDAVFPTRISSLSPGRSRYVIALDEAGYVMDDGLVCALADGRFYMTSTSGGADRMEAWLRDRADRLGLRAHVLDQTGMLGAINLAGPLAREVLARATDDDVSAAALPYMAHADVAVAGVPCRVVRVGFVGEVSFELHHPSSRGVELWDALLTAGRDADIRPHGLDALDVLRLEKGHVYIGQDTMPDDHPWKLGLGWTVDTDAPEFAGRAALERMRATPLGRKLVGLAFADAVPRGTPLSVAGRIVGRVTSSARSPVLGRHIGLGWVRAVDGGFPDTLDASGVRTTVVERPFYDPEGARLRA